MTFYSTLKNGQIRHPAFKLIAPYLADKSELYIYPDDDYDHLVVKNGKCVQVH